MRTQYDDLPLTESMKRSHRIRRFRRSNAEHGAERRWIALHHKPWKNHNPQRSIAA